MQVIAHECQENLHFFPYVTCAAEKLCQECERGLKLFMGTAFSGLSLPAKPDVFLLLGV